MRTGNQFRKVLVVGLLDGQAGCLGSCRCLMNSMECECECPEHCLPLCHNDSQASGQRGVQLTAGRAKTADPQSILRMSLERATLRAKKISNKGF